ncbi:MAG TPA: hypothetical protein VMZ31_12315 [Phycisphaerae bacterium]|nr:hypothetical protein [Phycisphaerae bacterium]
MPNHCDKDAQRCPFPSPRVAGVREHYQRVKFFHALAETCRDPAGTFRLLVAGLYSAQGVVELILEAAAKGELNSTREQLKVHLRKQLPWFDLIEKIRIHDFHRFGLVPPDPRFKLTMFGGPVKLRAQAGAAIYRVPTSGPEKLTTGKSDIQEQRPLLSSDGQFFDEASRQYVSLDQILRDFVSAAVETIEEFERNLGQTS